jgi:hypothetical protein
LEIVFGTRGAGAGLADRKENIVGVAERSLLLARILFPSLVGVEVVDLVGRDTIFMSRVFTGVLERDLLFTGVLERPCLPVVDCERCERLPLTELARLLGIRESACE